MEATHKAVETYILANLSSVGLKYSFNENNARDFTLPESPLLVDGTDDHLVITVMVENSGSACVDNSHRRLVGTIRIECYIGEDKSDRAYYAIADKLRGFLEATTFDGISLRDFVNTNGYSMGKWNVKPSIISFKTTAKRI